MKWKTRSSYNVVSTTSLCAAGAAWGLYRWGLLKKEWTPHWKPGSQCQPAWLAPVDVTLPREDEWLGTNRLHARSGLLPLKAFISVYFHFFEQGVHSSFHDSQQSRAQAAPAGQRKMVDTTLYDKHVYHFILISV